MDGGTPTTITYPHPARQHPTPAEKLSDPDWYVYVEAPPVLCGARIPTGVYGIHQTCRRNAAHDGNHQPYPDRCTCPRCAPDSPEWEPVETLPCPRCGTPTGGHDLHGTCPTP